MAKEPDTGVKQRLGPITEKLHALFKRYILENEKPTMDELQEADFKFARDEVNFSISQESDLCSDKYDEPLDLSTKSQAYEPPKKKTKSSARAVTYHTMMERFKAWADRMAVSHDGHLTLIDGRSVAKSHGKVILPKERFAETVLATHTLGGSAGPHHKSFMETVAMYGKKYTMGRRQFGISEDALKSIIDQCSDKHCSRKKNKKSHRNTGKKTYISPPPREERRPHRREERRPIAPDNKLQKCKVLFPGGGQDAESSAARAPGTREPSAATPSPRLVTKPAALSLNTGTAGSAVTTAPRLLTGVSSNTTPGGPPRPTTPGVGARLQQSSSLTDLSVQKFQAIRSIDAEGGSVVWKPIGPITAVAAGQVSFVRDITGKAVTSSSSVPVCISSLKGLTDGRQIKAKLQTGDEAAASGVSSIVRVPGYTTAVSSSGKLQVRRVCVPGKPVGTLVLKDAQGEKAGAPPGGGGKRETNEGHRIKVVYKTLDPKGGATSLVSVSTQGTGAGGTVQKIRSKPSPGTPQLPGYIVGTDGGKPTAKTPQPPTADNTHKKKKKKKKKSQKEKNTAEEITRALDSVAIADARKKEQLNSSSLPKKSTNDKSKYATASRKEEKRAVESRTNSEKEEKPEVVQDASSGKTAAELDVDKNNLLKSYLIMIPHNLCGIRSSSPLQLVPITQQPPGEKIDSWDGLTADELMKRWYPTLPGGHVQRQQSPETEELPELPGKWDQLMSSITSMGDKIRPTYRCTDGTRKAKDALIKEIENAHHLVHSIRKLIPKDTDSRIPANLVKDTDSRIPANLVKDTDSRIPANLVKDTDNRIPANLVKDTDSRIPANLVKDTDNRIPANLVKDTDSRIPANLVKDTDSRIPANLVKDTDSRIPANLVKDTDSRIPANLVKDTDSRIPANLVKDKDSRIPAKLVKDTDSRIPANLVKDTDSRPLNEEPVIID